MRLIDAEAFVKELKKFLITIHQTYLAEAVLRIVQKVIDKQPTIEAKPVVHAHWECDSAIDPYYCPHCGAQMDEVAGDINVGSKGVKIPVISMEDVPKIMEEMENNA